MKRIFLLIVFFFLDFGLSIAADLTTIPEKIEFGTLMSNTPTVTKELKIVNESINNVVVVSYEFSINPGNILSSNITIPLEIPKKTSKSITVSITPSDLFIGKLESQLILRIIGVDTILRIPITAEIKAVPKKSAMSVVILEDSVGVGHNIRIPVILKSIERNGNNINNFEITLSYNSTLLLPVTPTLGNEYEFGRRITKFGGSLSEATKAGDTILNIEFATALGNAVSTELKIVKVDWKSGNELIPSETNVQNGKVILEGIVYFNDIPRLISSKSTIYKIYPINNPIESDFYLTLDYISDAKLEIYTIDGDLLTDLSSLLPATSVQKNMSILLSKSLFNGPGIYVIKLSGRTELTSKLILIK